MFTIQQKCRKLEQTISKQCAKLPSDTCLWSAAACLGLSMGLKCLKKKHLAGMAGQWTAPLLMFGLYNKILKMMTASSPTGEQ